MKINLGLLCFSSKFHAFSVPTSIPAVALTINMAPSLALRAPYVSPTKSKYPGVSNMLNFLSFHSTGIDAVPMETFLAISSFPKSETVFPSSTFPCLLVTPVTYKIASVSVVFPLPLCPIKATFLILSASYVFIIYSPLNQCIYLKDFILVKPFHQTKYNGYPENPIWYRLYHEILFYPSLFYLALCFTGQ